MQFVKALKFCVLYLILAGCEPFAAFETAQPAGVKSLENIPLKLTGTYRNISDSSVLEINAGHIIQHYRNEVRYHKNELEPGFKLEGNLLLDLKTKRSKSVKLAGDSIIELEHNQDTVFAFSKGNILKKHRGHYFLNSELSKAKWEVKSLTFQKQIIILRSITQKEDLEKLKALTNSATDSVSVFNPTRKQFKEFVKQDGFSHAEIFVRIK